MSPVRRVILLGVAVLSLLGWASSALAQVPEFLGRLAVAVEPGVAAELGLSDGAKLQLTKLAESREDAAVGLSVQLQGLPKAEQEAKLAPFRKQSEDYAKRVLSNEQWAKLGRIVVRRAGLLSLRDPSVAAGVTLTPEQQAERDKLLTDLDAKSGALDAAARRALEVETERSLRNLLTPEQFAAWQGLAGETPGAATEAPAAPETAATTTPAAGTPAPANPVEAAMEAPAAPGNTAATAPTAGTPNATPPGTPLTPSLPTQAEVPATGTAAVPGTAPAVGATTAPGTNPAIPGGATAGASRGPAAPRTTTSTTAPRGADGEYQLKFNFRYQPWGEVLDWFARQADLSLVMDAAPPGTFNYSDTRTYSPAQAIDLLNSVLLTKGYTLLRRERMLLVVNLEDGVPPNLVSYVALDKIDSLGDYELVKTLFPLGTMTAAEAEAEIRPLLGPQGALSVLPKAKQIVVTETAGRLKAIRDVLKAASEAPGLTSFQVFELQHSDVVTVVSLLRTLMDIPADKSATSDGSFRFAGDELAGKIIVTGTADKVARAKEIIEVGDQPGMASSTEPTAASAIETPQLEVYAAGEADPAAVLAIMQTLLSGMPDVRLTTDPKTGNLVALARPSEHATIRATLSQLERDGRQVEVFRLRKLDPQLATLAITKLFGGEAAGTGAPKVEADKTLNQILVRGSQAQVAQIRDLLNQMGESQYGATDGTAAPTEDRGNMRMIPLTGRAGRTALEQLQQLWPTMRPNRIRVVSPDEAPAAVGGLPGAAPTGASLPGGAALPLELLRGMAPNSIREAPARPAPKPAASAPAPVNDATTYRETQPFPEMRIRRDAFAGRTPSVLPSHTVRMAAFLAPAQTEGDEAAAPAPAATPPQPATVPAAANPADASGAAEAAKPNVTGAEIVVIPGPGGLLIYSDDTAALDEFEGLLESLANAQFVGGREFTVFYLKSAPAVVVAETLNTIFSITPPDAGGGGGSLLGDIASSALGDVGGGMLGGLLGLGGGGGATVSASSGSLQIVPEPRLNALIVQGPSKDLDAIEQLLKVLDQEDLPDTLVSSKPRILTIKYQPANDILTTLKTVYADRLTTGSGGAPRQPSPEEFIQMLRGGRGGRGGQGGGNTPNRQAEAQKMSIGVDTRGNTLIIVAPQALYDEVEQLVATLDVPNESSTETTEVVAVRRTNATSVQKAIQAIVGPQATTTSTPSSTASSSSQNRNQFGRGQSGQSGMSDFFNNLQRMQGGRGGQSGRSSQSGRGGFGGGQSGRGGR